MCQCPQTSNSACGYDIDTVCTRRDKRGINLISDALPFGRLWYGGLNAVSNATSYAKFYSRAHDVVIRVYDEADNVIEIHEHAGDFRQF